MRINFSAVISVIAASLFAVGCAGPERKLGRGIANMTEFARCGEMSRSIEQTAVFSEPDFEYTTGVIHGLTRSVKRTMAGVYEVATFPIPNHVGKDYGPVFYPESPVAAALHPESPVYPDNYKPNIMADAAVSTDTALGFSGGDSFPFIPGSRFHVFDNN
jgi:putative exosortase-associated protein (TIGR04073 family)